MQHRAKNLSGNPASSMTANQLDNSTNKMAECADVRFKTVEEENLALKDELEALRLELAAERALASLMADDLVKLAKEGQHPKNEIKFTLSEIGLRGDQEVPFLEARLLAKDNGIETGPYDTLVITGETTTNRLESEFLTAPLGASKPVPVISTHGYRLIRKINAGLNLELPQKRPRKNFNSYDVGEQISQFYPDRHIARELRCLRVKGERVTSLKRLLPNVPDGEEPPNRRRRTYDLRGRYVSPPNRRQAPHAPQQAQIGRAHV